MVAAATVGNNEMKASDIKPGQKFIVAGEELYVSYIYYYHTSKTMRVDFENLITVKNPYLSSVLASRNFNWDDEVGEEIN